MTEMSDAKNPERLTAAKLLEPTHTEQEIARFVLRNRSAIFHALNLGATDPGVSPSAQREYRRVRDIFSEVTSDAD